MSAKLFRYHDNAGKIILKLYPHKFTHNRNNLKLNSVAMQPKAGQRMRTKMKNTSELIREK